MPAGRGFMTSVNSFIFVFFSDFSVTFKILVNKRVKPRVIIKLNIT